METNRWKPILIFVNQFKKLCMLIVFNVIFHAKFPTRLPNVVMFIVLLKSYNCILSSCSVYWFNKFVQCFGIRRAHFNAFWHFLCKVNLHTDKTKWIFQNMEWGKMLSTSISDRNKPRSSGQYFNAKNEYSWFDVVWYELPFVNWHQIIYFLLT